MVQTLLKIAERLNLETGAKHLPPLILLTDEIRVPDPIPSIERLPKGSAVILRHYSFPQKKELAVSIKTLCGTRGLSFFVADDVVTAAAIGADGLHLPEHRLRMPTNGVLRWRSAGRGLLICSAHSVLAVRKAVLLGADAVLVSPVFETKSHPGRQGIGVINFAGICRYAPIPVYALGGVNSVSGKALLGSGTSGIAAIGALT